MANKNTQSSLIDEDDDTVIDVAPNHDTSQNAGAIPDDRTSREQEARAHKPLHEAYGDQWDKPLNFSQDLPPRDGFVQRFVRIRIQNEDDFGNLYKKLKEGWRPRSKDSVPKDFFAMSNPLKVGDVDFGNVVGSYDMVLVERPVAMHDAAIAAKRNYQDSLQTMIDENIHSGDIRTKGLRKPNQNTRHTVSYATPDDD
jgi:hypothetical protein